VWEKLQKVLLEIRIKGTLKKNYQLQAILVHIERISFKNIKISYLPRTVHLAYILLIHFKKKKKEKLRKKILSTVKDQFQRNKLEYNKILYQGIF
jgi:hypothetical protein